MGGVRASSKWSVNMEKGEVLGCSMGIDIAGDVALMGLVIIIVISICQHSCSVYDAEPVEGIQHRQGRAHNGNWGQ